MHSIPVCQLNNISGGTHCFYPTDAFLAGMKGEDYNFYNGTVVAAGVGAAMGIGACYFAASMPLMLIVGAAIGGAGLTALTVYGANQFQYHSGQNYAAAMAIINS